jgi:hypothetical protein
MSCSDLAPTAAHAPPRSGVIDPALGDARRLRRGRVVRPADLDSRGLRCVASVGWALGDFDATRRGRIRGASCQEFMVTGAIRAAAMGRWRRAARTLAGSTRSWIDASAPSRARQVERAQHGDLPAGPWAVALPDPEVVRPRDRRTAGRAVRDRLRDWLRDWLRDFEHRVETAFPREIRGLRIGEGNRKPKLARVRPLVPARRTGARRPRRCCTGAE